MISTDPSFHPQPCLTLHGNTGHCKQAPPAEQHETCACAHTRIHTQATVDKLLDLRSAAREEGFEISLPDELNRIDK